MTPIKPIAVLGAGSWGTALALLLARNNQTVYLWSYDAQEIARLQQERCNTRYLPGFPFPPNLHIEADLPTLCSTCDDILIAVPSHAFRDTLNSIQPYIHTKTSIAWATKGLDPLSNKLLHEVTQEILGIEIPLAIISGPSFAKEVAAHLPTALTVATTQAAFAKHLTQRLTNARFRVYTSEDLIGVQLGGAVKNVLAIASGISDGLGFGANARSALITRGLAEMMRLGQAMKGKMETFTGLSGVGDLILTCTDNQSRNRRFGLALGQGNTIEAAKASIGQVIEGIETATQIHTLAKKIAVDMPITQSVYDILHGTLTPEKGVNQLFERASKSEY